MSALKRPGIWDKGPNVIQGEPTSDSNKLSTQVPGNSSTEEPKSQDTKEEPKYSSTQVLENSSTEEFKYPDTSVSEIQSNEEPKSSSTQVPRNPSTEIPRDLGTEELENQNTKVPKVSSARDSKNLSTQVLPKTQKNNRSKDETKPVRKQASVHLSGATLKALHLYAYEEGLEKSEVVEKALRKFIPKKFFE